MGLSCSCQEWDGDGWAYFGARDFKKFEAARRKRCCSCKKLIDIGTDALEFERFRYPISKVELDIYGDGNAIDIASYWMCEKCGEIYLNLDDLGFCIDITEKMTDLLKEYQEMAGFGPIKKTS
jgi:hypothetical protein